MNSIYSQVPQEPDGSIPVKLQDKTNPTVDLYFTKSTGVASTTATATLKDTYDVDLNSVVGFTTNMYIGIFSGAGDFYFGTIISINLNTITLDSPLDFDVPLGSPIISSQKEMNIDGSITRETFGISPGGATSLSIHITSIVLQMITNDPPEFIEFGDLPKLLKGLVIRRNNSGITNIFNIKDNSELSLVSFNDTDTFLQSNPQGVNGIQSRITFGGEEKHGTVIELSGGDSLEILIQDDLSGLIDFVAFARGHVVED